MKKKVNFWSALLGLSFFLGLTLVYFFLGEGSSVVQRLSLVFFMICSFAFTLVTLLKDVFLQNRFFLILGGIALLFFLSFPVPVIFPITQLLLLIFVIFIGIETYMLFNPLTKVDCKRTLPNVLSLGDEIPVSLAVENLSGLKLNFSIIDELPIQLQERFFSLDFSMDANEEFEKKYYLRPLERGKYTFGNINVFISTFLGLVERRLIIDAAAEVPVYPSLPQMKQFELKAFQQVSDMQGIKKMRRIGHSYEFEQIKEYVRGDDYRSINWKASSRLGNLMVNQYQDERAQQVYCLIDKSRTMKMPFNGLALLDYAINTTLVISNIALLKHDKAGMISFSNKIGTTIKAERKANQLNRILTSLYNEKLRVLESNFGLLYRAVRNLVNGRSLLFLFTNFESMYALERALPVLRRISKSHLLVVVFFENTEITDYSHEKVSDLKGIYYQTIAQKMIYEKRNMVQKLNQYGIQAILTRPEELSLNTVNKYLELKSRGLI